MPYSDPRQADTAFTSKLFEAVAETGKAAQLPVLNTLELYALGALTQPLLDDFALSWWNAQPDQEAAARCGYDRLIQRNMIDPDTGHVHPQLGIILAARSRPAFIAILRGQSDGEPLPGRFLGIADETAGLRGALGETVPPIMSEETKDVGPLYLYELLGPTRTSQSLASFASETKQLIIDLYLPGSRTTLPSERFVISRSLRRLHVERCTPIAPPRQVTCSQDDLAGMLLDTMTEVCR